MEARRFVVGHADDGDLMEKLARIDDVALGLEHFGP